MYLYAKVTQGGSVSAAAVSPSCVLLGSSFPLLGPGHHRVGQPRSRCVWTDQLVQDPSRLPRLVVVLVVVVEGERISEGLVFVGWFELFDAERDGGGWDESGLKRVAWGVAMWSFGFFFRTPSMHIDGPVLL